jgi:hypothetical protein
MIDLFTNVHVALLSTATREFIVARTSGGRSR